MRSGAGRIDFDEGQILMWELDRIFGEYLMVRNKICVNGICISMI